MTGVQTCALPICFGDLNPLMFVDIAYLAAISLIGYRHAVRRLGVLLLK